MVRMREVEDWTRTRYAQLLVALLAIVVASAIAQGTVGLAIVTLAYFLAMLAVVRTFIRNRWLFRLYFGLAVTGFVAQIVFLLAPTTALDRELQLVAHAIQVFFLVLPILLMARHISTARRITQDILNGSICIYLAIAVLWSLLYRALLNLDADALIVSGSAIDNSYAMLYFSFTTLTTLGYGDILPASPIAMLLANLEAAIGQIYPAIFIARLVSLYVAEADSPDSDDRS